MRMGLTPTDVSEGYQLALNKALEVLPSLKCWEVTDPKDLSQARIYTLDFSIFTTLLGSFFFFFFFFFLIGCYVLDLLNVCVGTFFYLLLLFFFLFWL